MTEKREKAEGVAWYHEMAILRNRFLWWDLFKISLIVPIAAFVILAVGSLAEGGTDLHLWIVGLACGAGLLACIIGVVGTSVSYGGRWGCTYRIGADGVSWEAGERERRVAARLTAVAAAVGRGGRGQASRDAGDLAWRAIRRANFHPAQRVISLRNSWRVVMRLYIPNDDWGAVADWVRWGLAEGERQRAART